MYKRDAWLIGLLGLAGGVIAGILFAPQSGQQARALIARRARAEVKRLEDQLHALEAQLAEADAHMRSTGREWSDRMGEAAQKVVDHYVPSLPDDPEDWQVEKKELARDLRRMPRR